MQEEEKQKVETKTETQTKEKKPKKSKRRMLLVFAFLIILAIISYVSLRGSYLEMAEIGENYIEVFFQSLQYKVAIAGINFIIVFLATYITTRFIKKGLKKFFDDEKKEMPKLPNKSISLVIAAIVSIFAANFLTQNVMLALNNTWFGINDPIFNMDIAYYVFQKPFIELVIGYIIAIFIGLTIYLAAYYIIVFNVYFDGIDVQTLKKNTFLKHIMTNIMIIAIGIACLTFVKSQDVVFGNFLKIDTETPTYLSGAGATDVFIKVWGYRLLAVVIVVSVFLAIRYFKQRNTKKTIIALLTVPGYLVIMFLVMTVFQIAFVKPNELDKEKKYIAYNIENTKNAYNVNIEEVDLTNGGESINAEEVKQTEEVLNNVAIVDSSVTVKALEEYQKNLGYYSYRNTKLQEYNIDGKDTLVYSTPREIIASGDRTYNNKTYEYTHGYGTVLTSAVNTDENGNINYIQKDFDGADQKIKVSQPRIYFGLETNDTIITNSKNKKEFDYPINTTTNAEYTYDGQAGIKANFLDRMIMGIKERDFKLAFSTNMTEDTKILTNRNIIERAKKIMPYLTYDEEPYLVINDEGKQIWVLDAYTTTNKYPYSQETTIEKNGTRSKINYIRNSVKVLIDAYDGTVKFYITDRSDPIAMAYRKIYPSLFEDLEQSIPQDVAKHITYPEYLYNIQSQILTSYHNVQPEVLYRSDDLWDIAMYSNTKTNSVKGTAVTPYYTMVKTIDETNSQLGLVLPYTQYGKQNIISYLVGTYDEQNNGKLKLYKFGTDANVIGPMQLDAQIEQDETISKELSTLNVTGTKTIKNMILVPINNKLLYVEPVYQVLLNESEVPTLKKVIVASGNKVAIGNNLEEALTNLVSKYAVNIEVESTDNAKDLVNAIIKANNNLMQSTTNNDWEMIGKDTQKLQTLISQLEKLMKEEEKKNEALNKETKGNVIDNTIENSITENTEANIISNKIRF